MHTYFARRQAAREAADAAWAAADTTEAAAEGATGGATGGAYPKRSANTRRLGETNENVEVPSNVGNNCNLPCTSIYIYI